jgi:hypothetical protein
METSSCGRTCALETLGLPSRGQGRGQGQGKRIGRMKREGVGGRGRAIGRVKMRKDTGQSRARYKNRMNT